LVSHISLCLCIHTLITHFYVSQSTHTHILIYFLYLSLLFLLFLDRYDAEILAVQQTPNTFFARAALYTNAAGTKYPFCNAKTTAVFSNMDTGALTSTSWPGASTAPTKGGSRTRFRQRYLHNENVEGTCDKDATDDTSNTTDTDDDVSLATVFNHVVSSSSSSSSSTILNESSFAYETDQNICHVVDARLINNKAHRELCQTYLNLQIGQKKAR